MLPILFHAPLRDFVTVARWVETMICRGHSSSMNGLFLYCRAGFENECAAEIQFHAGRYGMAGYVKTNPDSGYVLLHLHEEGAAARLHADLPFAELIFTRQWFVVTALLKDLPVTDRVSALLAGVEGLPESPRELFLETPATNEAKELAGLCRALQRPMEIAARIGKDRPSDHVGLRLHCCLLSGTAAYVGYASRRNSAPWAMGIPRLRLPRGAPCRSTPKLEEAFLCLPTPEEQEAPLQPGTRAVDLGAARKPQARYAHRPRRAVAPRCITHVGRRAAQQTAMQAQAYVVGRPILANACRDLHWA